MSGKRIRAILRKELREYRRNGQIVVFMAVYPLIFTIYPAIEIFALPASAAATLAHGQPLIFMLGIPAIVPATLAALAVAGERQQGTLEPVLTTPVRREEFLLGKALAALAPALAVSYGVFAVFVAAMELFAQPAVASAMLRGPELAGQALFTPLLAALSIWIGLALSTRFTDPRAAAQLSALASLPSVFVTTVIAVGAVHVTLPLAMLLGAALLLADGLGWRIVSPLFNRERLIADTRGDGGKMAKRSAAGPAGPRGRGPGRPARVSVRFGADSAAWTRRVRRGVRSRHAEFTSLAGHI